MILFLFLFLFFFFDMAVCPLCSGGFPDVPAQVGDELKF